MLSPSSAKFVGLPLSYPSMDTKYRDGHATTADMINVNESCGITCQEQHLPNVKAV
jgi:hypothetical protein